MSKLLFQQVSADVSNPDYKITNDYNTMLKGEDAQLKKAVNVLLGK